MVFLIYCFQKTYAESEVPFLLDESDTVLAYEKRGQSSQESDTESRDPLMAALSGMDRVQQLEMIYGEKMTVCAG